MNEMCLYTFTFSVYFNFSEDFSQVELRSFGNLYTGHQM